MRGEQTEVLVVGAGQAGLAMSEHLSAHDVPHLVLERSRIAERWRSERWDSLVANGPAWHDRFPSLEFSDLAPDDFATKEQVADYFVAYADKIAAPIRCGVAVTSVQRNHGRPSFQVQTSEGTLEAAYVVSATGAFQRPSIPPIVPNEAAVVQLHSSAYRNPSQLPDGAVLVVGAGSSGVQIADELLRAGRPVYLSVGPHERPPRRYRGRDFVWWLGVLGKWDVAAPPQGGEHVTIAVSGAHGGRTVDFRDLAARGMTLVGTTTTLTGETIRFAPDLAKNIAGGDANFLSLLREADAFVERTGIDLPKEPAAHDLRDLSQSAITPPREINLTSAGITAIIWATGFTSDYSWLQVDAFDSAGTPARTRGFKRAWRLFPWTAVAIRRGSSFIWGVWHDARYIAEHIAIQRGYLAHRLAERAGGGLPALDVSSSNRPVAFPVAL